MVDDKDILYVGLSMLILALVAMVIQDRQVLFFAEGEFDNFIDGTSENFRDGSV